MYGFIFIQSLAIFALLIWAASYHFKKRKTILLVQLISFLFWIWHFILLDAFTGAAIASIGALRLALFSFKTKSNWISKSWVLVLFFILLILSTIFTYTSPIVLLALIGGIFATLATWQNEENKIRLFFLPSHIFWIIYDLSIGSYAGAFSEAVIGLSALVSLIRNKS